MSDCKKEKAEIKKLKAEINKLKGVKPKPKKKIKLVKKAEPEEPTFNITQALNFKDEYNPRQKEFSVDDDAILGEWREMTDNKYSYGAGEPEERGRIKRIRTKLNKQYRKKFKEEYEDKFFTRDEWEVEWLVFMDDEALKRGYKSKKGIEGSSGGGWRKIRDKLIKEGKHKLGRKKEEPKKAEPKKAEPKKEKKPTAPRGYGVKLSQSTGKYYYYDLADESKSQFERPKRKTDGEMLKEKLEVGKYYYLKSNKHSQGVEVVKILKLGKDKLEYEGRVSKESPARGMFDDIIKREVSYENFKPLKPKSLSSNAKLFSHMDWDGVYSSVIERREGKI